MERTMEEGEGGRVVERRVVGRGKGVGHWRLEVGRNVDFSEGEDEGERQRRRR